MDGEKRFELAALLGMALANLSLEQELDPLREKIPDIQRWLLTEKNQPPIEAWLKELKGKLDPLPTPLLPGGDEAAAILYYANARAPLGSSLKSYLYYVAHYINTVTFSKD